MNQQAATAKVLKLPKTSVGKDKPKKIKIQNAAIKRQAMAATAIGAIGLVLTTLSLKHLSHGVEIVTGVDAWESWAMAIGIDLSFIALEVAQLCCSTETLRKEIEKWTKPSIVGTMIGSAAMNAFAFGMAANGLWIIPAVTLGLAIPTLIYILTRISVKMYLNGQK